MSKDKRKEWTCVVWPYNGADLAPSLLKDKSKVKPEACPIIGPIETLDAIYQHVSEHGGEVSCKTVNGTVQDVHVTPERTRLPPDSRTNPEGYNEPE